LSAFVDQHCKRFGVEPICRILGVSASAYYHRATGVLSKRARRDQALLEKIREVHASNSFTYGSRRKWKALKAAGVDVGRDEVARIMRQNRIHEAKRRARPWITTVAGKERAGSPDLVERDFTAEAPNRLWVADFTYLRCHRANQPGATLSVQPELVEGTPRAGWSYCASLPTGFARAVFMMFLVTELHPFSHGSGRTARLMMNAELTAADLCRFIVPISYREDYLGALRALSRGGNPGPLGRSVSRILRWVGGVDWSSTGSAQSDLEAARAFDDGVDARLRIP